MRPVIMQAIIELDIESGPRPGTYEVRVARSLGGGQPSIVVDLDVDAILMRRPGLESSILASAVHTRRVLSEEEDAVRSVGLLLFESVFTGAVGETYRMSRAVAAERGHDLQVRVRTDAAELAALPWETLFDPELGTYVCRRDPLVRVVPVGQSREPLAVTPPLRILAMVAAPANLEPIDVASERERLEEALAEQLESGHVEIEWLEDVSWRGLHSALLTGRWHVLHFVGHGGYDDARDEGLLAFVGRDGRAEYVDASSLSDLLDEADPTPRLVVLNSCRSAAGGSSDLFSSVAAALVRNGIDAVVAMQFSISDAAAIEFSNGFYAALAHGRGIDAAARSGRIGILGLSRGTLEWVTPVLFLRGDESRLFELIGEPESSERSATGDRGSPQLGSRASDQAPGPASVPGEPVSARADPATPVHVVAASPTPAVAPAPTSAPPTPAAAPAPAPAPAAGEPFLQPSVGPARSALLGRVLWGSAFAGAVVGAVASLLFILLRSGMTPPEWLGWTWLVGFGLAGLAGAFAVGVTGVRRRISGVLLALAPYAGLLALFYSDDEALALAMSLVQLLLIWAAHRVTRR
jgi:hypothetical protein